MIALRGNPRGVFSSFTFSNRLLPVPQNRRGDWEHATLLFCAWECRSRQRGDGEMRMRKRFAAVLKQRQPADGGAGGQGVSADWEITWKDQHDRARPGKEHAYG